MVIIDEQMPKYNRNSDKRWGDQEIEQLKKFIAQNTPTRVIGIKLGRTPEAIYSKSSELDISLKPTNQSPYTRRKER